MNCNTKKSRSDISDRSAAKSVHLGINLVSVGTTAPLGWDHVHISRNLDTLAVDMGEAQYSSYQVWSIAKCWCQGIITCRLTPRLVGIYSSIRGVMPSFQVALSKIKTNSFDDIRTFSCSVLSSSTINYAEQCQTAPDTIDTGSGTVASYSSYKIINMSYLMVRVDDDLSQHSLRVSGIEWFWAM